MTSTLVDVMRDFEFTVSLIQNVASMFGGTSTEFLSGFADVRFGTIVAEEHIDHVLCLTVHGLLNRKDFAIFHLDTIAFDNVSAALAIVARIVAFEDTMFFL